MRPWIAIVFLVFIAGAVIFLIWQGATESDPAPTPAEPEAAVEPLPVEEVTPEPEPVPIIPVEGTEAPPGPERTLPPPIAARSPDEIEREKKVARFAATLADETANDQTRYDAAAQLGQLPSDAAVSALEEALEDDTNKLVRRAAAWSLGQQGKRAVGAIPTLIEQVGSEEQYVGYMAARALGEIAKEVLGEARSFGFSPTMTLEERRAIRKQWREWWEANREKLSAD
jgi:HEAT repeat protein